MEFNEKKAVIIWGASEGGKNYIKKQNEFEILAIVDNDKNKVGQMLSGYPIIAPNKLFSYKFEYVVITSMYFNPIKKELLGMGINSEKIIAAPKHLLKPVELPFEDDETFQFAINSLQKLIVEFNELGIRYFVDFGTLLGIVREGKLISWDDDIDISIPVTEINKLLEKLDEIILKLSKDVKWNYKIIYNNNDTISSLVFNFEEIVAGNLKQFSIDIWIIYFDKGFAIQTMNKAPEYYFLENDTVKFEGESVSVPKNYLKYLEHTYGDWRTPKKNITFADYPYAYRD